MAEPATPPTNGYQEDAKSFHKKDDRLYRKRIGAVSDDLSAFRHSLVAVLDELEKEIKDVDREDDQEILRLRAEVAHLKKLQEIERHNAAARNYNGAMDTESDFMYHLKGVTGDSFDNYIEGFPELVEDIDKKFSGETGTAWAEGILRALGIDYLHTSDVDNHSVKRRGHQRYHKDVPIEKLQRARLKRQLRIAIGLAPNPIRISAVHVSPIDII